MTPLAGRHALVTGAGTGVGAAIARALASAGARVTLTGRREAPLREVADSIGAAASVEPLDVTDAAAVAALVARLGPVDILVNNAGRAYSAPFDKTPPEAFADMMGVNLAGVWTMTQAVWPGMIARRSGRIINIASTAGIIGYSYVAAYVAAKHAVVGLTRALALEGARKGVTVNAVCPGFTETPLLEEAARNIMAKTGRSLDEARAELAKTNPAGKLIQPEEVADSVVWLASPGAGAVTGQCIVVAHGEAMAG